MSEPHQHGEPQPAAAAIENAEVEEVVCEGDFDQPDPRSDHAADVRKSKVETNTGIANFLRNASNADLDKLLAMIQAERTSRMSSKSKAARRAERKKRAAAKKQAKAEKRKKNAGAANVDGWTF